MKKLVCAALAGMAAMVAAVAPADATVFTMTFYGTAYLDKATFTDQVNHEQKIGLTYKAILKFDDAKIDLGYKDVTSYSAWYYGNNSGIISASVMVDEIELYAFDIGRSLGYVMYTDQNYDGDVLSIPPSPLWNSSQFGIHLSDVLNNGEVGKYHAIEFDTDISIYKYINDIRKINEVLDINVSGGGFVEEDLLDLDRGELSTPGDYSTYLNFYINRLVITREAAPAVPEPATWAMMLAGFGLVGVAMRRRSKTVAAIA